MKGLLKAGKLAEILLILALVSLLMIIFNILD